MQVPQVPQQLYLEVSNGMRLSSQPQTLHLQTQTHSNQNNPSLLLVTHGHEL